MYNTKSFFFSYLITASTDKTVRVWDMDTGTCIRKFKSHKDIVNSCHPARRGPQLVASGSDDCTVLVCFFGCRSVRFQEVLSGN